MSGVIYLYLDQVIGQLDGEEREEEEEQVEGVQGQRQIERERESPGLLLNVCVYLHCD